MKLYYMPGACSLSDHIALEWAGAHYEAVRVARDQLKSPDYLAINPSGAVPALQDEDGWVLTENVAILDYIAQRFPDAQLGGREGRERAEVLRWTANIASDVHKAFAPLFAPARFADSESAQAELRSHAVQNVRGQLARIDAALGASSYLTGEQRSVADAYLYVVLRWADRHAGGIDAFSNLKRFRQRMEADPAVRKVLADEDLD